MDLAGFGNGYIDLSRFDEEIGQRICCGLKLLVSRHGSSRARATPGLVLAVYLLLNVTVSLCGTVQFRTPGGVPDTTGFTKNKLQLSLPTHRTCLRPF